MFRRHHGLTQDVTQATDTGKAVRRLLTYFQPFRRQLAVVGILIVLSTLLQLAGPYLTGIAVDSFISPGERSAPAWLARLFEMLGTTATQTSGLTTLMILLLAIYLLDWVANAGQFYLMMTVGQRVLLTMRTHIFERIQELSLSFFDRHEAGDLMSRLVNDTGTINRVFSWGLTRMASLSLSLTGILITMLRLNWQLALASFTMLPVMVVATTFFSHRARTAFRRTRETIGDVSAELQENISAVREVQAFSRERETLADFEQVNAANRDANVQAQSILSAFSPTLDVLSTIALAIVVGFGGYLALTASQTTVTVGLIVSFLIYVRRFYQPIRGIATQWAHFQGAVAGAERIFELLDTEPEIVDAPDAEPMPPIKGRVTFDHVSFAYEDGEPVLQEIDLTAEPGEMIALVGPTGVGKTTMISLLSRMYDVDEGAIRIDGHDVRQVTRSSLRQQTGVVLQDTFLFSGTVRENVRYGRLDAADEEIVAAAKLANAHQFITRMPEGYETELGERGQNLSQGQRQLLSIARAILADPRLLILDEATSSVDTRTERLIQQALDELLKGRTSFVIAHRLSTIRNADQVVVLREGQIIERGTHDELLAAGNLYADLYNSQFRRE